MTPYKNGYIPESALVTFNTGFTAGEGNWKHQLSPGTYAKHLALVELARKNTGRTLTLSAGWSGYRPFSAQVYARNRYGVGAATPGTSSHGGFWEGQQTLAIDYGNWSYVYGGSRAAFYRDVRAVGMEPGLISRERGYPDEPWHVVDKNPWAAGAAAGIAVPAPTMEEGFLMALSDYEQQLVKNAVVDINNRTADMAAAMKKSDEQVAALHAIYAARDVNGWSWADVVKSHVVATLTDLRSAGVVNGAVDLDALTKRIVDEQARRLVS